MRLALPSRRRGLACREVVELVTAYVEDTLGARDRARFEAHISRCDGCAAYVEQLRVTIRLTGAIDGSELSADAREHLVEAFRDWRRDG